MVKQRAMKGKPVRQVAALPFRVSEDGTPSFMLVTSRETRRFVFPKGWRMRGRSPSKAAAIEAEQEAGVRGRVGKAPIGRYAYWKRTKDAFVSINVDVYALLVHEELPKWKEARGRKRRWVDRAEALLLIDEPELLTLIRDFDFGPGTVDIALPD